MSQCSPKDFRRPGGPVGVYKFERKLLKYTEDILYYYSFMSAQREMKEYWYGMLLAVSTF